MNGFINVLKPVGATASDVVVCIKHVLHEKKVGHLGTLDPGASGVLPVAVGQGTKLFDYLTNKVKYYRAFFTFGKTTDTLDSYGVVTQTANVGITAENLQEVLATFVGEQQQMPPSYSAISVGGVRAYKLARNGEQVQLSPRQITVYSADFVRQVSDDTFVVDIRCSGGTYIRSIARDVAEKLGTVGYMSGLIRLQSGCFDIEHAYTLDEVKTLGKQCLVDVTYPLQDLPDIQLDDKYFADISNGRKVPWTFGEGYAKVYCKGTFWGVGKGVDGVLKLDYYLKDALQND